MSMSMHVAAIILPHEQWEKMKAVYDACESAGVSIPDEVERYFHGSPPDADGFVINMNRHESVESWNDGDMEAGFQVDLNKLPNNVRFIRFYNSY